MDALDRAVEHFEADARRAAAQGRPQDATWSDDAANWLRELQTEVADERSKGSRGDSGELEAEQDRLEAQEQERRTGRWIGCGDFEFDCGIDRAVVSVIRDRSDGKPEIETEFEASLQRLIDMRDGAERAIRFLLEGTSDA